MIKQISILGAAIFLLTSVSIAQTSVMKAAPEIDFDQNQSDKDVYAEEFDDNLYISLILKNEETSGFYTFERSYDNENYVILSKKTFSADVDYENRQFTFISKLPDKPAMYRIYKFTPEKVSLVKEYEYYPHNNGGLAEKYY
ncbi:MAG: hypothetical protein ACQES0_08995 [Bacteroidota bacterium]